MDIDRKVSPPQSKSIEEMFTSLQTFARGFYTYEVADTADPFVRVIIDRATKPQPGFEVDGEFYRRYKDLSMSEDRQFEAYFDLGVDLGGDILERSKNDRDKVLYFMNAYNSMNFIQTAIVLHDDIESEMIHSRVAQIAAVTLFDTIEDTEKFRKQIFRIMEELEKLENSFENDSIKKLIKSYHNALVLLLGTELSRGVEQGDSQRNLVKKYETGSASPESEEEIRRLCDLLTQEAMSHRKYGTKPAYIEASVGGSWIFYDGEDFKDQLGLARDISSNVAAIVLHSPDSDLKDLRLQPDKFKETDGALAKISGAGEKSDMMIYITHDGELTTDQHGLNLIERTFKDNLAAAQRMKAEIVSNFYDLSMPVYKKAPEPKNFPALSREEKEDFDPIQQMLIPRVRLLDREPSQESDIVRTVREHDVTWFVRLLPSGFHATAKAIAAAAKHGIVLDENETFVKSHKRGTLSEKVLGYHAIRR